MNEAGAYVPYETLARAEAGDILEASAGNVLKGLSVESLAVIEELLADAHQRGLETGFALSSFNGENPITPIEAYKAGIVEGERSS